MRLALPSLLLCAALAAASPLPPAGVRDAAYGPHERHRLDLWLAQAEAPAPLVIFIHGGGWHGGGKADLPADLLAFLLAHRVSVASINYRYTSIAPLPGPLHDAARAVQFLRARAAEWRLDPARVAAYGVSAGGCSALWLACHDDLADPRSADPVARQSSRLQGAVGMSAQTSLDAEEVVAWVGEQVLAHPMIARAVGAKKLPEVRARYAEFAAAMREGSPIRHVSRDDPPVLLSYPTFGALPAPTAGAAIHHAQHGRKLQEKAAAAGAACLLRIEDAPAAGMPTPREFLVTILRAKDSR